MMVADPGKDRFSEQAHEIGGMLVGKGGASLDPPLDKHLPNPRCTEFFSQLSILYDSDRLRSELFLTGV